VSLNAGSGWTHFCGKGVSFGGERREIYSPEYLRKALKVQVDRPIETVKGLLVA